MSQDNIIKVSNLYKSFGKLAVLKGIVLNLKKEKSIRLLVLQEVVSLLS